MTDRWNENDPDSYPRIIRRLRNNVVAKAWLALMETYPIDQLHPAGASMFSFAQGVHFALHALDNDIATEAALQANLDEFLEDCE